MSEQTVFFERERAESGRENYCQAYEMFQLPPTERQQQKFWRPDMNDCGARHAHVEISPPLSSRLAIR
jgi:hypothetical protein